MFEKIFNKDEKIEITEPAAPAETQRAANMEVDPQTGILVTKQEADKERKANFEDPTRRYDLK